MTKTVPNLATVAEASTRYNCHPRTIRRLIESGEIGSYRVGPRLIRVDLAETDAIFFQAASGGDK